MASLLLVPLVGPATAAVSPAESSVSKTTVADEPRHPQQTTPTTNNSTVRHRDPDAVESENRLGELQGVLNQRLAERLGQSSTEISRGQYEQARELLGEEYLQQLEQYGEVAEERGDANATSATETYNETRQRQREYADTAQEFRETSEAYQTAKQNGDNERARTLARELVRLEQNASRQSARLDENLRRLGDQTGTDLSTTRETVQSTQADINQTAAEVADAEFVDTRLRIRRADETGSFSEPLRIAGTLESDEGPVANRSVRIDVGEQRTVVETNATGAFSLAYRPATVPVNTSSLAVRYVPEVTSVFGASNASIPVSLTAETATVRLNRTPDELRFADPVTALGVVTVNGTPVDGLPVTLAVDGVPLGTRATNETGDVDFNTSLAAAVSAGRQRLTVRPATENSAVRFQQTSTVVRVQPTETTLTARAIDTDGGTRVTGRLTADARPVANQRVAITLDGERLGSTRTAPDGSFTLMLGEDGLQAVTVRFDGEGTNLDSSATRVELATAQTATATPVAADSPSLVERARAALTSPAGLVAGGVTLGLGGLAFVFFLRRRETGQTASTAMSTAADTTPPAVDDDEAAPTPESTLTLSAATDHLDAGDTDDAVVEAYRAVRAGFSEHLTPASRTHWQFFEACVAQGVDAASLRTLTEAYEIARYGGESASPSVSRAESAIAAARDLLGIDDSDPQAQADDD